MNYTDTIWISTWFDPALWMGHCSHAAVQVLCILSYTGGMNPGYEYNPPFSNNNKSHIVLTKVKHGRVSVLIWHLSELADMYAKQLTNMYKMIQMNNIIECCEWLSVLGMIDESVYIWIFGMRFVYVWNKCYIWYKTCIFFCNKILLMWVIIKVYNRIVLEYRAIRLKCIDCTSCGSYNL